jgi:phenylalanyl-tRNA synthetase beta subunit
LKRKDIKSDADWIEETIMETLYENFEADVKASVSFREVK